VRAIRDDDPRPLSTVDRSYRGDLDTIVGTAMAREPEHRYQSAGAFKADLVRHLEALPITARPPSTWYQVAKFSRRHQGLVAGLALAFVMLIAGTIVSTVFAIRAGERSRLLAIEARRLESANAFFTEMLDAANPEINRLDLERPRDVKVADVLDYAAENIGRTYVGQPEVEISTRATLGMAYSSLELTDKALEQVEEALRLARSQLGDEHPETLRLVIRRAGMARSPDENAESERRLRQALPVCEEIFGRDNADTIACLNGLAGVLFNLHRLPEACEVGADAVARARRGLPRDHEVLATAIGNLAAFEQRLGHADRAEVLCREALALRVETFGDDHPATIRSRSNLAWALFGKGRTDEAIAAQREVVAAQRRVFGDESGAVLFSLNTLAGFMGTSGDVPGARDIFEEVVEIRMRKNGPDHGQTLLAKYNLAHNYMRTKEFGRAETLAKEVIDGRIRFYGDDSIEVANSRNRLGEIYLKQERYAEAVPHLDLAVKVCHAKYEDWPLANTARSNLARCLMALERYDEAAAQIHACYDSAMRTGGADHAMTRQRASELAHLYECWGRQELAAEWRARSTPAGPGETAVADRRTAPGDQ